MKSVVTRQHLKELTAELTKAFVGSGADDLGEDVSVTLVLHKDGDEGFMLYASTTPREGSAEMMREMASRIEHRPSAREYLKPHEAPVRFTTERIHYSDVLAKFDAERGEIAHGIRANGERIGVVTLKTDQEAAWLKQIFRGTADEPVESGD